MSSWRAATCSAGRGIAFIARANTTFSATTSTATGQIVNRLVRRTGSTMIPVMFATASTPDSARTTRTRLVQCSRTGTAGIATTASERCGTAQAAITR